VLATVTNGDAMAATIGGLAAGGTLMVLGGAGKMTIQPLVLLGGRRSIKGWYSGTAVDSEETMAFSALTGVRSMNELFPLEKVEEAYARMATGAARFRAVLTMKT
jgi:D-arabinose 1-dehydrogenase-like Zn-dependent alcohol dehydrogenase